MMAQRDILAGVFAAALVALPLAARTEDAPDTDQALDMRLELGDPATGQPVQPQAGQPLRLTLSLTDTVTGAAPRGIRPRFFARPVQPGMSGCEMAGRAFLATGRTPAGAVGFANPLLAYLVTDGALSVVDPRLDMQGANMVAALRPASPVADLLADPERGRLILSQPDSKEVLALPVTGGETVVLARDLAAPRDLALWPRGVAVAVEGGVAVIGPGGQVSQWPLGQGAARLSGTLAFTPDGAAILSEAGGDRRLELGPVGDAVPAGPGAVLSIAPGQDHARLTYVDAPQTPVAIPVGAGFTRLASDPGGRVALAWTPGRAEFALLDLALGQVVQAAGLDHGATVSEVLMTTDRAYLLSTDGGFVGLIDADSVVAGRALQQSRMMLGGAGVLPQGATAPRLMAQLGPEGPVVAIHTLSSNAAIPTAFVIDPMMALNGQPASKGTLLRGGTLLRVVSVPRDFTEYETGRFRAVWGFAAGDWELVVTTGPLGVTRCLPFAVQGARLAQALPVRAVVQPDHVTPGVDTRIELRLIDERGQTLPVPDRLDVRVSALGSGWRVETQAHIAAPDRLGLSVLLPHEGPFMLYPVALPPGLSLQAAAGLVSKESAR